MTGCLLNATETGDQQLVKTLLRTFCYQNGCTNYLQLVRVPSSERIPILAKTNRKEIHQVISAQIEYCMKFINIPNGLNLEQIFLLADTIIDDSESDNLSLQDVFLFLQKLSQGKMGTIYNRLDIPTFMELFEVHRQERHIAIIRYREEEAVQHKTLPFNDRLSDMFPDTEKNNMREAMKGYLKDKSK